MKYRCWLCIYGLSLGFQPHFRLWNAWEILDWCHILMQSHGKKNHILGLIVSLNIVLNQLIVHTLACAQLCLTFSHFSLYPLMFIYIYILVNKDGHRNLFVHPRNKNGVRVESNEQSFMKLDGVALF